MSSQNLLSNVFKPAYTYDSNVGYTTKVNISNIDTITVETATVGNLNVGDPFSNVYVGTNAGNLSELYEDCNSKQMTAIGVNAAQSNRDCCSSVFIGLDAGTGVVNSINEVGIGTGVIGGGSSNIYLGALTGTVGSGNIFIGPNISPSNVSNELRIGKSSNIILFGDLSAGKIGINTTSPVTGFDVSSDMYISGKLGIQTTLPKYSLDVLGRMYTSDGILVGSGSETAPSIAVSNIVGGFDDLSTGMYSGSNAEFRGRYFGFTVNGQRRMVLSDTCVNIFANLFVDGTFGVATSFGSKIVAAESIRMPDSNAAWLDMSQGSIITSNQVIAGGRTVQIGNGYITDTSTNGYFRMITDGSGTVVVDISGGNISNSATTTSSNFITPTASSNSVGGITLSNTRIGIGKSNPVVALEVVGDVSATTYNGPGGSAGAPHYTFSDDRTTGVFFPGANIVGLTAGGVERMRISNSNIGIGTNSPSNALDVSGVLRIIGTSGDITLSNGAINVAGVPLVSSTGAFSNTGTTSNSIGGITLSNSNVIVGGFIRNALNPTQFDLSGGTLSNSNIITSGYIRNSLNASEFDLSGGTLRNSNTITSGYIRNSLNASEFDLSGGTLRNSNTITSGYIRNALNPTEFDLSGGNLRANRTLLSNGTVAAPSYTFSNDATTGLHLVAASQLGFDTGGTQRMVISNSNVGIGTGAPTQRLQVGGAVRIDSSLIVAPANDSIPRHLSNDSIYVASNIHTDGGHFVGITESEFVSTGTSRALVVSSANVGMYITRDAASATSLFFKTRSASTDVERMRIMAGGNVGIGTAAPAATLDVSSDAFPQVIIRNTKTAAGNDGAITVVGGGETNTSNGLRLFHNSTELGLYTSNSSQAFQIYTNNLRRFAIDSNGNIGIGIGSSNPTRNLDISGSVRVINSNASTGALFDILPGGGYATTSTNGYFTIYRAATTDKAASNLMAQIPSEPNAPYFFLSNNFGIGMSNPQKRLDVSSAVQSDGIRVSASNANITLQDPRNADSVQVYADVNGRGLFTTGGLIQVSTNSVTGGANGIYVAGNWLGVGTSNPGYQLDVSGAVNVSNVSNQPALRMNTWSFGRISNVCIARDLAGIAGTYSVNFNSLRNAIDSNLATVTHFDATLGSSFVINKSGIWSITFMAGTTAGNSNITSWIDVHTSNVAGTPAQFTYTTLGITIYTGVVNYTGYLPSNAGLYYKPRAINSINQTSFSGGNSSFLSLTFLQETSNTTSNFPN